MKILMNRLLNLLNAEEYDTLDYYIGKSLLDNMGLIPELSIVKLAEICNVSKSKLSNFIRKIGFEDYKDFRLEAVREYEEEKYVLGNNISIVDHIMKYGEESYFQVLKKDLDLFKKNIDREQLKTLVRMLHDSSDIAAFGTGHSEAAAIYLQAVMGYLHKAVYTTLNDKKQEKYILNASENSVIVIFSNSGRFLNFQQLREGMPARNVFHVTKAKIVLVTSNRRMENNPDVDLCLRFEYSSNIQNHSILFELVCEYILYEYQKLYEL